MNPSLYRQATYNLYALLMGKMLSTIGATIYSFAVSMYILQHTGSSLAFAINLLLSFIPRIIMAPISGTLADRYSRKKLVLIGQGTIVVTLAVIASYSMTFGMSVLLLYVTSVIIELASGVVSIAFSASIPNLVDAERIQKAMSFQQLAGSMSAVVGPIIGGVLFGFLSFQWFFIVMAVAMALEFVINCTMKFNLFKRSEEAMEAQRDISMKESILQGWRYIQKHPLMKNVFYTASLLNFFFVCLSVGTDFALLQKLHIAPKHIGFIEAFLAIGMIGTTIYFSMAKPIQKPLHVAKWSLMTMGVTLILFSVPLMIDFTYSMKLFYLCIILCGFGILSTTTNMPLGVWLQKEIDEDYRGRVFGLLEMMAFCMMPLGTILYGVLFDVVAAELLFIASGICVILLPVFMLSGKVLQHFVKQNPAHSS